jgi:hypothetical protein
MGSLSQAYVQHSPGFIVCQYIFIEIRHMEAPHPPALRPAPVAVPGSAILVTCSAGAGALLPLLVNRV